MDVAPLSLNCGSMAMEGAGPWPRSGRCAPGPGGNDVPLQSRPKDKQRHFACSKFCLALSGAILLSAPLASASAHHLGVAHAGPAKGLAIPNLTHGQMVVIAANRSAILKLADEQNPN